ncbi:HdeD family acid-resistance protein [Streptosporangium lutulentum]|uniref:Uncharacterized membrane protein HdeD (DUF308 family) n=1 Tax=Streptosporangium lutulentum TaxID=1461250 RepID=A0ABT9QU27_9ACTN|nr:HdeD family acid-resistance protein [Streptosporangium lutulentum]MDP9849906.1 uncharacterized membrane protein HdeD (DUF308 family) [Streptosporangium lutulentum]
MEELARTWWVYLIRGLCALLFGLLALIWPGITLYALVVVFGVYAIANGVFELFSSGRGGARSWMVVSGVGSILIGAAVLLWPGITALVLLLLIAAWAVVVGILEIVAAIRLRRVAAGEWTFVVSGALAVLFGVLLFLWPVASAMAVLWLIGVMAILYGISLVAMAFRLRGVGFHRPGTSERPHPV